MNSKLPFTHLKLGSNGLQAWEAQLQQVTETLAASQAGCIAFEVQITNWAHAATSQGGGTCGGRHVASHIGNVYRYGVAGAQLCHRDRGQLSQAILEGAGFTCCIPQLASCLNENETGRQHMHQVLRWAELLVPSSP